MELTVFSCETNKPCLNPFLAGIMSLKAQFFTKQNSNRKPRPRKSAAPEYFLLNKIQKTSAKPCKTLMAREHLDTNSDFWVESKLQEEAGQRVQEWPFAEATYSAQGRKPRSNLIQRFTLLYWMVVILVACRPSNLVKPYFFFLLAIWLGFERQCSSSSLRGSPGRQSCFLQFSWFVGGKLHLGRDWKPSTLSI